MNLARGSTTDGQTQFGRTRLPDEQQVALKKAIRWQVFTICYTAVTITIVAFVLGSSQAMKTAWIEDMLSLIPQVSFLVALIFIRKPPSRRNPFGYHRAMGVGHLVAGVALSAVGIILAVESITGLVTVEHPAIGGIELFGTTIWLGWLMIGVMALIVIGPFIYGRAKAKLAPVLHNKLLFADADMAKADWHTNAASIVGVLGVGLGIWWLDGAAAIFISLGIIADGFRNTRIAVIDLMDQRARTCDSKEPHPLIREIARTLRDLPWVTDAAVRMRDQGQVFHVEAFVVPKKNLVDVTDLDAASRQIADLDWKVQDVSVIAVSSLPEEADPARG